MKVNDGDVTLCTPSMDSVVVQDCPGLITGDVAPHDAMTTSCAVSAAGSTWNVTLVLVVTFMVAGTKWYFSVMVITASVVSNSPAHRGTQHERQRDRLVSAPR